MIFPMFFFALPAYLLLIAAQWGILFLDHLVFIASFDTNQV
jgi:hypothetical protein